MYYGVDLYTSDGTLLWGAGLSGTTRLAALRHVLRDYRKAYPLGAPATQARLDSMARHYPAFYALSGDGWRRVTGLLRAREAAHA